MGEGERAQTGGGIWVRVGSGPAHCRYNSPVIERFVLLLDWFDGRGWPIKRILTLFAALAWLAYAIVPEFVAEFTDPVDFTDQEIIDVYVETRDGPFKGQPVKHQGIAARLVDRHSSSSGDAVLRMMDTCQVEFTNEGTMPLSFDLYDRITLDLGAHPALAVRYETPTAIDVDEISPGGSFDGGIAARIVLAPGATVRMSATFRSTGSPEALVFCARVRAQPSPLRRNFEGAARCHLIQWHFPPAWL